MESPSFTYTALPPGRFFRLLSVHPGAPEDNLICDLFPYEIDTAPPYTALSYVWGDPTKSAEVTCSGHACNITQSLSEGLRRIRKADEPQIAWADAICINQNDMVEKGHQVDLMGVIYDTASNVLVWLGPDPSDSAREAFRCLSTINEKIWTRTDQVWYSPPEEEVPMRNVTLISSSGEQQEVSAPTARRSILGDVLGPHGRDAISKLFGLTWFTRVWVLQEVGLAEAATAFWGDAGVDFAEIAVFIANVYGEEDLKYFLGPEISGSLAGSPLYALWNVWCTYGKPSSWVYRSPLLRAFAGQIAATCDVDFTLVLEASRYFDATNELDHVYAFLGHPKAKKPGTDQAWLRVDYALSVREQHRLLAVSMAEESLNFLVQAQHTDESLESTADYPSWVPRWNEKTPLHADAFWEAYDASRRKVSREPFRARADGDRLAVSATIIDSVDSSTARMDKSGFEPIEEAGGRLLEQCWAVATQKPCPYGPQDAVNAFASTLTCHYKPRDGGGGGGGGNAPGSHHSVVEQLAGFCMRAGVKFWQDIEATGGLWSLDTTLVAGKMFGPQFKAYGTNRRFFNTEERGLWGLGPAAMRQGDVCAVIFGADVPFVLRPVDDARGEYKVVGECYMYKFMDGEAVFPGQGGQVGFSRDDIVLV
ncbi:uncharacterized protein E0L32_000954 [Thyridium curvatum]|uniref:Heterokaryon incompatibility domain-containing protein n=1 Tax=Thyridium curvatum TaxID=1093900 RepID=A0A507AZ32_9PEZI|nr:uncharacterized protein E0L32_000954 [Thyridium curvatum]TPX12777.1 hypothetical protein E0L32_000954 [Thyridium curvatum]